MTGLSINLMILSFFDASRLISSKAHALQGLAYLEGLDGCFDFRGLRAGDGAPCRSGSRARRSAPICDAPQLIRLRRMARSSTSRSILPAFTMRTRARK